MESQIKKYRVCGYDIIINQFEPLLCNFIQNEILMKYYQDFWKNQIPKNVISFFEEKRNREFDKVEDIRDFLEAISFISLKKILLKAEIFQFIEPYFGSIEKSKFGKLFNILNSYRNKIAHPESSFVYNDLCKIIEIVRELCQGEYCEPLLEYLEKEGYNEAKTIPTGFFRNYQINYNLPEEEYNQFGGFVGREDEILNIRERIFSGKDRIITLTGAGGAGKSAIALKIAYQFLEDEELLFNAILWFSAKRNIFTETGIQPLTPQLDNYKIFLTDILKILNYDIYEVFSKIDIPLSYWEKYLYTVFESQKYLVIIDNLETILLREEIINFIVDIPRPSCVLITSRKGLGRVEWPIHIGDLGDKDAIQLFRMISKARNISDLENLDETAILSLVKRVKCYPLLIKWSIAKYQLGKPLEEAFNEIFSGDSEIAKFAFNDVFNMLDDKAKKILYSLIILGSNSTTKPLLEMLANLSEIEFEAAIQELELSSLVFHESHSRENGIITQYNVLALTKGYLESKLNEESQVRIALLNRYHDQIKQYEESVTSFQKTILSLGIKSTEEKIAFNHVKTAKKCMENDDEQGAFESFEKATKIAPLFDYPWMEFSKFESQRKNTTKAIEYAKKATIVGKDNFHSWFNLGLQNKKVGDYYSAIEALSISIQINSEYLPNYSELGYCYTQISEFEQAEINFKESLKPQENPNFKHQFYALTHQAESFYLWSIVFQDRNDFDSELGFLRKAEKSIVIAKEINPRHYRAIKIHREINYSLGKCLGYKDNPDSLEYLKQAIEEYEFNLSSNKPNSDLKRRTKKLIETFRKRFSNQNTKNKEKKEKEIIKKPKKGLSFQEGALLIKKVLQKAANQSLNIRFLALDKIMRDNSGGQYLGAKSVMKPNGTKYYKSFTEFLNECKSKNYCKTRMNNGFLEVYLP
jgi:Tfp pilus assembly protein PilF